MNNYDIETFYNKISIQINNFVSLTGNKELKKLLIACRLKPVSIFNSINLKMIEYVWADEFDKLLVYNNKLFISIKDEELLKRSKISTDLYYGRSLSDTLKISKSLLIIDNYILCYGIDEYFRCFDLKEKLWVSALNIKIGVILKYLRKINHKYYRFDDGYEIFSLPNSKIEKLIMEK